MKRFDITTYIKALEDADLLISYDLKNNTEIPVSYLTFNSKEVVEGTLFICKGVTFKEQYLLESLKSGASCYITEIPYVNAEEYPNILVKDIRKAMPILANIYDNEPWKELCITAVGGTKGKTTTSFFLKGIADAYLASTDDVPCGLMSTIEIFDGITTTQTRRTTPEAVELQHILRRCADNDVKRLCMEVSSQGFKYDRVAGMRFDMTIFLNIGEDHISPNEHSDFDDYLDSKMMMFPMSDKTVVNLDIDHVDRVIEGAQAAKEVFTYSSKRDDADYKVYDIHKDGIDTVFSIKGPDMDENFRISLPGLFNVDNAAAAIIASFHTGVPMEFIKKGIYGANAEGRMEIYASSDNSVLCVVDYAHNGFSFQKLFESVKEEYPDRYVIALFGLPGGKAYTRRQETGTIAGQFADEIILTADDPANEKVIDICNEVAEYVKPSGTPYTIIEDREEAVAWAIANAPDNSIILLMGKGAETNQAVGNGYVPCLSDAEAAKKYLK